MTMMKAEVMMTRMKMRLLLVVVVVVTIFGDTCSQQPRAP